MSLYKDISNKQFGNVLAIKYSHNNKEGIAVWECKCLKCNNMFYTLGISLRNGNTKQCLSCAKRAKHIKALDEHKNLEGQIINNRKLIKLLNEKDKYLCECFFCKKQYISTLNSIKNSKSCKCTHQKNKYGLKHGFSGTPFYKCWAAIKDRCFNKTCKRYNCYGARGIKICDRWLEFTNFRDDMLNSYNEFKEQNIGIKPTIDRINVNGNYEPTNCRWLSRTDNNKNTRKNLH